MKKTLVLAALFTFFVFLSFLSIIHFTGNQSQAVAEENSDETDTEVRFVPPLERINQEHEGALSENSKRAEGKDYFHTKTNAPERKIFQTLYKGGTQVVFNHKEHVEMGLGCIECHHVERCSKCHLPDKSLRIDVATSKQAFHENCIGCHSEYGGPQTCGDCHKQ